MTIIEKLESGMAERRAELINQPLARVWGELAKTAFKICHEHAVHEQMKEWGLEE